MPADDLETPMLPQSLKIGPVEYRVSVDGAEWAEEEGGTRLGMTHNRKAIILLNPAQPASNLRLTLMHEALHALLSAAMGAPDLEHLGDDDEHREERLVLMFEAPMLSLLRDNPELVAYLVAR
jgi:hypothetical protein